MIKIYGTVYHSLDYTILDNDSLFDLVFKGNKDLSDISRLDYVDGIFSILYENSTSYICFITTLFQFSVEMDTGEFFYI